MARARQSKHPVAVQLKGRSAAITIAFVAFSVLAIAVVMRMATRGEAQSHRVVVVVQGCGPSCDEKLARALSRNLQLIGFDAVAPAGLSTMDDTRAFAREHGARFGVGVVIAVEDSAAVAQSAGTRVGANALAYVLDSASNVPLRPALVMRGLEEADDTNSALQSLSSRLATGLFPGIASALLSSEPVRALEEHPSGLEQQAAALELKRKQRDLLAREQAMRDYKLHCEHNDELLASVEGGHCVSSGCAEEYLVGLLPDGSAAIVHDSTDTPVFPLSADSTARAFATSEKLWLVPKDGARKLLAEAANFYSRPALSRNGSTLVFIEQRLGQARLYALDVQSGTRSALYAAPAGKHLSSPELAPDGQRATFYQVDGSGSPSALYLVSTRTPSAAPSAAPIALLPNAIDVRFVQLAIARGEPARMLIAALVPGAQQATEVDDAAAQHPGARVVDFAASDATEGPEGPRPELVLLDPGNGAVLLRQPLIDHRVRALGGMYGDALLLSWEDRGCGFGRWSPGGEVAWTTTRLCPKHLAVGANGVYAHALLSEQPVSRQLVRVHVEHGEIEVLTKGNEDVQNPMPAAAADSLAYERVLPRKYGELQHVAVCFDGR